MKIRTKLAILPIALAIIMLTISLLITLIISNSAIRNQVGNHLLTTAHSRINNIETLLNDYKNIVQVLSVGIPFTNILDPQIDYTRRITECNLRIKRTIEINPYINGIKILNKNGIVIASSNEDIGLDRSEETVFIKGRESVYIGEICKSEYTGNLVLSISTPIYVRNIFSGVLIINFDIEKKLFEIMTNRIGLGETGEIYLVNKDGFIITPSGFIDDAAILETKINTEQINLCILEHIKEGFLAEMEEIPSIYSNYTGRKVLGTHYYISEIRWGLIVEFDITEVNRPINKQTILFITIFSVLLIITLIVAVIISKNITKPIIKLHEGTEEIIKGNLEHKVGIESKDEIGQLSRSFDNMTDKFKKAQNKLKNYTEDLETTVNERTAELNKQFEKSEKQRIATIVVVNDLNKTTKELKAEITERQRIEEELAMNFQQQKLLTEISCLFTKLGRFDENMKEVLHLLGEYTGVSRVYVFENFNNREYTKNTYEWCNKNIESQIDNLQKIPYKMVPSWKKFLTGEGMVLTNNILELPQDLIDILKPQKIKSIFILPIYVKDQFFGFMGFDDCEKHRIWDKSEIELLKTVTNIVSSLFERKQTEQALHQHTLQLQERNEDLDAFSHTVAHDLKNPLGTIMGFAELLFESYTELSKDEILDYLSIITQDSEKIQQIINNLLLFASVRKAEINTEELNMGNIVAESINSLTLIIEKSNAEIKLPETWPTALGYAPWIEEVWVNYLSNALKYSGTLPYIEIGADTEKSKNVPKGMLRFWVRDNGPGISADNQKLLFKKFERLDQVKIEGHGLGLSIVYRIIEKLGGQAGMESNPDSYQGGSLFYFTLPYSDKTDENAMIISESTDIKKDNKLNKLKILIAEDDKTADLHLTIVLKNFGKEILHAKTGKDTVMICKNNPDIDLVLMDIRMPEMSGYEATRKIREFNKDVVIIAQTAYVIVGDRENALEAGCDDYISKPINKKVLLEKIERFFS